MDHEKVGNYYVTESIHPKPHLTITWQLSQLYINFFSKHYEGVCNQRGVCNHTIKFLKILHAAQNSTFENHPRDCDKITFTE